MDLTWSQTVQLGHMASERASRRRTAKYGLQYETAPNGLEKDLKEDFGDGKKRSKE